MSTTDPLRMLRLALSIVLAVAVGLPARVVSAAPQASETKSKTESKSKKTKPDKTKAGSKETNAESTSKPGSKTKADTEDEAEPASEAAKPAAEAKTPAATPEEAMEAGDLATALELARSQRKAEPSAANWHQEAQILEQMGDYAGAKKAYRAELDALPTESKLRAEVREDLQRVEAKSRGTVPSEPKSTHRAQLDERWAPRPEPSKPGAKEGQLPKAPDKGDRIITKWYFWVTVAAIVASAAAVTGIAIKAARDDKKDALDLTRQPTRLGPTIIRF